MVIVGLYREHLRMQSVLVRDAKANILLSREARVTVCMH